LKIPVGVLDERVEHARVRLRDRDADATLVTRGQTAAELVPVGSTVDRLVNAAARPATVEAPRTPLTLIGRGVQYVGVGGVHHEVHRTRVLVDVQDLVPRATAVGGLEDATLRGRRPQVA